MKNIILLSLITMSLLQADKSDDEGKKILEQKLFEKAFKKKLNSKSSIFLYESTRLYKTKSLSR